MFILAVGGYVKITNVVVVIPRSLLFKVGIYAGTLGVVVVVREVDIGLCSLIEGKLCRRLLI